MGGRSDHHHDHHHGSDCSHEHGGHSHVPKVTDRNKRRVGWAAILTGLFTLAEIAGGIISGSLALLADAGHMLTDFAALALAWIGFAIAQRPASPRYSFGLHRVPILTAFVNGLTLLAVAIWILVEAAIRLREPSAVLAGPMLVIAVLGLLVNLVVLAILSGGDKENLNIRGAMVHVMGDLLGSAAAIIAALVIMMTDWVAIDPILSALVAVLIIRSGWSVVRDSAHVLLEGTPAGIDLEVMEAELLRDVPGLETIESLKAWSITPEQSFVLVRGAVGKGHDPYRTSKSIRDHFNKASEDFEITIELTRKNDS